jgi:hypothetical protein
MQALSILCLKIIACRLDGKTATVQSNIAPFREKKENSTLLLTDSFCRRWYRHSSSIKLMHVVKTEKERIEEIQNADDSSCHLLEF